MNYEINHAVEVDFLHHSNFILHPFCKSPQQGLFDSPNIDPQTGEVSSHSSQHTLMKPIKAGKEFLFKIEFENLSKLELGALWWISEISGQQNFNYAHHLGMGKPIGMGAIKLTPTLNIVQKNKRYKSLIDDGKWADGKVSDVKQVTDAIRVFEEYIFSAVDKPKECTNFHSIPRVLSLLKMLEWHDPDNNKNKKQYSTLSEFRNRPVLPSPFGVWTRSTASEQNTSRQTSPTSQNKVQGTVKWYGRGTEGSYHGYIIIDRTNEEIHINARDLQDQNFLLNKNDRVEFIIKKTGTKTYANSVKKYSLCFAPSLFPSPLNLPIPSSDRWDVPLKPGFWGS